MKFEKQFEQCPERAIEIVKERTRLMGKMLVECQFYKLMPDGETRLIKNVRRKPYIKGGSIYVRLDGINRECSLDITLVSDGHRSTTIYSLIPK